MEKKYTSEATCDNCGRVYQATARRYYCFHCDKFFYICSSCVELVPKCRHCGIPLKRRTEPQFISTTARRSVSARN